MNVIIIDYFVLFYKIAHLTKRNKYHNMDFFYPHIQQNLNLNIQSSQDNHIFHKGACNLLFLASISIFHYSFPAIQIWITLVPA